MVQLNTSNSQMIFRLFQGTNFDIEQNPTHIKYTNHMFDIIVKNNTSIVVIDKRHMNANPVVYNDLKVAFSQITGH